MAKQLPIVQNSLYRRILGVDFFVGDAAQAVELGSRGGLVVVPAAPALMEIQTDVGYRQALLNSDLAITDSGFLVLCWKMMTGESLPRVSGLKYLRLLLARPDLKEPQSVLWVMPSRGSMKRNLEWLRAAGFSFTANDCYVAPRYPVGQIVDDALVQLVNRRRVRHVIICLGGGVQEKLGFHLRQRCPGAPAIHCIGAAIGFLTGDQVRIPDWADELVLGWLFRCAASPGRFVPRYTRAFKLGMVLWQYRSHLPDMRRAIHRH